MTKGIILAGGSGSRLYPLTEVVNKQLIPVYDKPMIYYPLTTLIEAGVQEICIISSPAFINRYKKLFGSGIQFGLDISYIVQPEPKGIAQAFILAEDFIGKDRVALILGDNIFVNNKKFFVREAGATIFGYRVQDPRAYGVVEFDRMGKAISIEEKPEVPKSEYAVPGLYLYDNQVVEITKSLAPSKRGELEITDVNRVYMDLNHLHVIKMERGSVWLDAGTSSSLHSAACYVQTIQERQGIYLGCPEEAALKRELITCDDLFEYAEGLPSGNYKQYLIGLCENEN